MIWLIAEDDTDILSLVATMTKVWGHTPLTFSNGQQVWDWLDKVDEGTEAAKLPEFALMDIRMPGKKGNELARRIRRTSGLQHIPIALMTAFMLSEAEQNVMRRQDGVDRIIAKPLPEFQQLFGLLTGIIEEKRSGAQQG
ncbi:MAG: response regulator [Anaerolineaceae bacterium]|nr:response regulator [Anaerolineaceae bacterium]